MDGITAASAIVGLLDVAFSVVQAIRKARDAVKGATKTLANVSGELGSLEKTLELVRGEALLQTPAVEEGLNDLIAKEKELQAFFETLKQEQDKHKFTKFWRAMKTGDKNDTELQSIMGGMSSARDTLSLRIQVIHVGLTGNQIDGFRVAYDILKRVDANVKKVLGGGLKLARVLEERKLQPEGDTVQLADADVLAIDKVAPLQTSPGTAQFQTRNFKAGDNLKIVDGHLGFEAQPGDAGQHSTMDGITVGKNAAISRGNVSKDLGSQFITSFWGGKSPSTPEQVQP